MSNLPIRDIVIHATATYPSMDIGAKTIDEWHRKRFRMIGYHYVIKRDGTVEKGREDDVQGAHTVNHGKNHHSLGIALAGGLKEGTKQPEDNFTDAQWKSLNKLLDELMTRHNNPALSGHCEWSSKACPCFDIASYRDWFLKVRKSLYKPDDWWSYDWHHHSPSDFNLPDTFMDAVDTGE